MPPVQNKKFRPVIDTRGPASTNIIKELLENSDIEVVSSPLISISGIEAESWVPRFKELLSQLNWVIFTSRNGVRFFFDTLQKDFRSIYDNIHHLADMKTIQFAVVGRSTARELKVYSIVADHISEKGNAAALARELNFLTTSNTHAVFIAGNLAGTELEQKLGHRIMARLEVYQTTLIDQPQNNFIELIKEDSYSLVIVNSPSAARSLAQVAEDRGLKIDTIRTAAMGERTAEALKQEGNTPEVIPEISGAEEFARSIIDYLNIHE